jgi:hypothetical protein
MTLQRSLYYFTFPRVRLYREPTQVWICWFGWSLHYTASSARQGGGK